MPMKGRFGTLTSEVLPVIGRGVSRLLLAAIGLFHASIFYGYTFPDEQERFLESGTIIGPGAVPLAATIPLVLGIGLMSLAVSDRSIAANRRAAAIIAAYMIEGLFRVGLGAVFFSLMLAGIYVWTTPKADQRLWNGRDAALSSVSERPTEAPR